MRKYIILSISLFVLCSCGIGGSTEYVDQLGNFTADFPEDPETFQDTISSKLGDLILYQIKAYPKYDDNLLYSISYMDLPRSFVSELTKQDTYDFFLGDQQRMLNDEDIISTGIQNITILGYVGRQFKWHDTTNEELLKIRYYLVEDRLYMVAVKTPVKNNFNKKINAFLDSFELINTDPNPNAEEVVVVESKFTIDFPGPTKTQEFQSTHQEYGDLNAIMEAYEPDLKTDNNILYGLATVKYTRDLTQMENFDLDIYYEKSIKNTLNSRQTTLISKKNITQNGLKGVETKENFRGGLGIITQRTFLDKDVLISVQVISNPGKDDNQALHDFFNSLRPKENP